MTAFDDGLLSPVAAGVDDLVRDEAFLGALVRTELALVMAYADIGMLPSAQRDSLEGALGPLSAAEMIDIPTLAAAAVAAGNPVLPLVPQLKARVPEPLRDWVHAGATSQDIWDTAIMAVARDATTQVLASLGRTADAVRRLSAAHGDDVVVTRTLTQHAVPTTFGARMDGWLVGIDRAADRLAAVEVPVQLAGAGGTLASFVEITGSVPAARALVRAFAARCGLGEPAGSWHVARWPVTGVADALVQVVDALSKIATDVATLSRTEIGELAEGIGGVSSAMPQKKNPVEATLIRSAALRAPQLGATLHLAAALAGDERPDGAWHAEWPTFRELMRLALGASAHAASLAEGLRVDSEASARNLTLSGGLIVSERLSIALLPLIGRTRFDALMAAAVEGVGLEGLLRGLPETAGLDVDDLLDPSRYTGARFSAEEVDA